MNQLWQVTVVVVIVSLFSYTTTAAMASNTPFISEVYPAPNADESEWIELMNPSDEIATISGWLLYDQVSSPSLLLTITTVELAPHEFIVFDLPTAKLNNTGDSVALFNQNGVEVDRFTYNSSEVGKSWQRYAQISEYFLATPTKSTASVPPPPTHAPTPTLSPTASIHPSPTSFIQTDVDFKAIQITEVVACPNTNEREWIKLHNTSDAPISLENWYILDAQGNQRLIHGVILSKSDLLIDWDGAILNNQGDSISLFTSTDQLSLTLQIPPCIVGASFFPNQSSSDPPSTHTVALPPTQPSSQVTISATKDTPNGLGANNNSLGEKSFIPPMPSITIERPQFVSSQTSAPIQIHSTSTIKIPAFLGAIISFSSLLLAYYYFNVFH
ncbi:MAG TPA: lamin tail domain-containing protein [Candidatus Woesebacteria bacterium]|nr:lamin tail domain-containing protein [Candidatus Woesebacteria bacterium]HNS65147.1 lamin tail domain-containing protein [Candidatus Woesebacteria bacterium]